MKQYFTLTLCICALFFLPIKESFGVSITFKVNMNYQIDQGKFNAITETVDVAGTFNGWGSTLRRLNDNNEDGVYEISIDGFSVGQDIEFKFRFNGQWDGREEFPGVGNNRSYKVLASGNVLEFWYNDQTPPDVVSAQFEASSTEIFAGGYVEFFDRSGEGISYRDWRVEGSDIPSYQTADPVVKYPDPGTFDVQLTIEKNGQRDTVVKENYITVLPQPNEEIPWWNQTVFYEIFVRSFYDSNGDGIGDFQGIIEKLDYLNDGDPNTNDDLGITGIWLMPIHPSPSYHGYDVIDYKGINPDYGTMNDFREFLAAAHARGIKVIIDFVMNHSSSQHPWFQNAVSSTNSSQRNWYRWSATHPGYNGPWGQPVWHGSNTGNYYGLFWSGMPDLNYETQAVKDSIFAAADFWLEDVGIDGFRVDAVKYIFEDGQQLEDTEETFQFFNDFNQHIKATDPEAFAVGEAWTSTSKVRNYVLNERLDYCFEFDLAGSMLDAVNSKNTSNLSKKLREVYSVYPYLQYGSFLTNHDQNRIMNVLGRDVNKAKVAASLLLTLPGIPFMYYGEEIGMVGQKPDEFIRTPMQWSDGTSAGFSSSLPWISPNSNFRDFNVADQLADPSSLLNGYKQLIDLRNDHEALQIGELEIGGSPDPSLIGFYRFIGTSGILVVINTSSRSFDSFGISNIQNLPNDATAVDLLNVGEPDQYVYNVGNSRDIQVDSIAPYGIRLFQIDMETSSEDFQTLAGVKVYPNPVQNQLTIFFRKAPPTYSYTILDLQGREIIQGEKVPVGTNSQLDLGALSKGVYLVKIRYRGNQFVSKFIKQ